MNKISNETRRQIADEVATHKIWYYGDLNEPDFLAQLFDLKSLKSRDCRY